MGKSRKPNEAAMRETIKKLVTQRDEARAETARYRSGSVSKSEHDALYEQWQKSVDATTKSKALLDTASDMFKAKCAALKADCDLRIATAQVDLTAQVSAQNDLIEKLNTERAERIVALDKACDALAKLEHEHAALTAEVKALKAEDVKKLRKRLNGKTEFIAEQERYIRSLTTTIRHFMQHPAIVEYVAKMQARARERSELMGVGAPISVETSPTAEAIVNAEATLASKPVEVEAT